MKFIALFIFLAPLTLPAQTVADYKHVMEKFQQFYNAGQGDSITAMINSYPSPMWSNEETAKALKDFGTLTSFKFIGIDTSDPHKDYVFETQFSKAGVKTTSLTLHGNLKVGDFRFITTSECITALLKKQQKHR